MSSLFQWIEQKIDQGQKPEKFSCDSSFFNLPMEELLLITLMSITKQKLPQVGYLEPSRT